MKVSASPSLPQLPIRNTLLDILVYYVKFQPNGRDLMIVGVANYGGFRKRYCTDEEPLFADDLDEYEEQEEDDPPPLPPPIQGTVQTTPQRDQGMPAVNLCICIMYWESGIIMSPILPRPPNSV